MTEIHFSLYIPKALLCWNSIFVWITAEHRGGLHKLVSVDIKNAIRYVRRHKWDTTALSTILNGDKRYLLYKN